METWKPARCPLVAGDVAAAEAVVDTVLHLNLIDEHGNHLGDADYVLLPSQQRWRGVVGVLSFRLRQG